jgi:mono/diheme cytochrome c family protein
MFRPALLSSLVAVVALIVVVACASDDSSAQTQHNPSQRNASQRRTSGAPRDTFRPATRRTTTTTTTQTASRPALPPAPGKSGAPKSAEEAEQMMVQHPATQPVPLLTADETIPTFNLPPGLRIQVVAHEPMVEHPIAMAFAPDGKLWVVEMRGYMPDVEGTGERKPNGRVSVLEDTNGDGRMDKSTIFWDGLVLPRAIGLVRDGALIAVPPNLWYCRDTDGDGRSDQRRVIAEDYGIRGNPEHQPNGLLYNIDNWIYSANYARRIRYMDRDWALDAYQDSGQWGITQDDWGRLYTNNNSNYLRVNLVAPHYTRRNPHYRAAGVNVEVDNDQTCWPAHFSAINRGYRPGVLRPDNFRLAKFTGACGPTIYRGGLLPPEYDGNYFTGEVTANFVRRSILTESGGRITGNNAYEDEQTEFLTTTYERFRPVNTYTGPEGALYIVDMHHGLIQHKEYVTPYVAEQYRQRELGKYLRTGRIYRIVPDDAAVPPAPNLAKATPAQLVTFLSHRNGWVRDTAQRLLVERKDPATVAPLKALAAEGESTLGRLHALWALEGIGNREAEVLVDALQDPVGKIRANAIRLSEPFMPADTRVFAEVLKLQNDDDPDVRLQFALSVSAVPTPEAQAALVEVVTAAVENQYVRDAAISGLEDREMDLLERLLADPRWSEKQTGRDVMLTELSRCVIAAAIPQQVERLTDLMANQSAPQQTWRQLAMLESFPIIDPKRPVRRRVTLTTRPASLDVLAASTVPEVQDRVPRVMQVLSWPGKNVIATTRRALTETELARFDTGKTVYAAVCGQCHKPDGMGQAGLAPPLVDSEWVLGEQQRLIKIVLHGLRGPITVNDQPWDMDMPHLRTLSDDDIAAALTYVRREWEHDAEPVTPQDVAKVRTEFADRLEAWTARELAAPGTNRRQQTRGDRPE